MLEWSWADARLAASRNYWIVTSDEDGRPRAVPVWGVWFKDSVIFGGNPESRKVLNLRRDPRVLIHLESGDEVVILEGEVEWIDATTEIAAVFEPKYEWKPEVKGWIRLRPRAAYAWTELEYPKTATRFDF